MGECLPVNLDGENFHLGSLNTMMMNLDELVKYELQCDNLLKKVEKIYNEISTGGSLSSKKIDSKHLGSVSIYKYLKNFEWDEIKFPRSGDIIQPIKEKLVSLDKSVKVKIQEYQEAKLRITTFGDESNENASLYTLNLNDLISGIEKKQGISFVEVFDFERIVKEKSRFLKNVLVFIPKRLVGKFEKVYTELDEAIVENSYQMLGMINDFCIVRVVYFKEFAGNFIGEVKEQFKGVCREFEYDSKLAEQRKEQKMESKLLKIDWT